MLNITRLLLLAAGLAGFAIVAGTIALAQENSSSTTPSSATPSIQNEGVTNAPTGQPSTQANPSNLPKTEAGATEHQSKAPVVDPHANAQNSTIDRPSSEKTGNAQGASTQEWPAPQRYEAGSGASANTSGKGRASLGVNVVGSQDGQGVVVARIRPGTPAEQMGLRPRDRILSLNGQPVASVDGFIGAIRGMGAGEQVQLTIERDGNARDIGGQLEAFREAIAAGDGSVGNIVGRAREFIGANRTGRLGDNMQTSYEDSQSGRQLSGDLEARLSRVEQQLSQLTRELAELRIANRSSSVSNPALPEVGAAGQPSTSAPSTLQPTTGQPPSVLQPQSR